MRISDWSSDVCSSDLLMLALRVKPSKMDTLAGYLAYGVFLVHLPVIRILHLEERNHLHFLIALVLATLISLALHFAAERWVTRLRHRIDRKSTRLNSSH